MHGVNDRIRPCQRGRGCPGWPAPHEHPAGRRAACHLPGAGCRHRPTALLCPPALPLEHPRPLHSMSVSVNLTPANPPEGNQRRDWVKPAPPHAVHDLRDVRHITGYKGQANSLSQTFSNAWLKVLIAVTLLIGTLCFCGSGCHIQYTHDALRVIELMRSSLLVLQRTKSEAAAWQNFACIATTQHLARHDTTY